MIKAKNLIKVAESLKHESVKRIVEEASRSIEHRIPDVTSFEHTCYTRVGDAILSGHEIKSLEALSKRIVRQAIASHLSKTKYEVPTYIESLARVDEDGNEEQFEIEDVLADVEEKVLGKFLEKEKVTLLAKGDKRREKVLKAWASGVTNASEISRLLAQSFGGKYNTHRVFVKRFKTECRETLITIA